MTRGPRRTDARRTPAALLLAAALLAGPAHGDAAMTDAHALDPLSVERPASPNTFLAAPPGAARARIDAEVEDFPLPADALAAAWVRVVERQPRAAVVWRSPDGLLVAATDRTPLLRFVDDVVARIVPRGEGRSSIAVYGRSRVGWHDMGANRARVEAWLAELRRDSAR